VEFRKLICDNECKSVFLNFQKINLDLQKFILYICFMPKKNEHIDLVRIDKKVVAKVRKLKEKTGVSIGKFFELAAEEKLKRESKS